jgi:hypothetical protein
VFCSLFARHQCPRYHGTGKETAIRLSVWLWSTTVCALASQPFSLLPILKRFQQTEPPERPKPGQGLVAPAEQPGIKFFGVGGAVQGMEHPLPLPRIRPAHAEHVRAAVKLTLDGIYGAALIEPKDFVGQIEEGDDEL